MLRPTNDALHFNLRWNLFSYQHHERDTGNIEAVADMMCTSTLRCRIPHPQHVPVPTLLHGSFEPRVPVWAFPLNCPGRGCYGFRYFPRPHLVCGIRYRIPVPLAT